MVGEGTREHEDGIGAKRWQGLPSWMYREGPTCQAEHVEHGY